MATKRDAGVNMLRATMATFTAGIAGADSLTVLPHTMAHGLPDAFARRIARNTQTVLLEESNLWRVADPSAGAGATEALTDELCQTIGKWRLAEMGHCHRSLRDRPLQHEKPILDHSDKNCLLG